MQIQLRRAQSVLLGSSALLLLLFIAIPSHAAEIILDLLHRAKSP